MPDQADSSVIPGLRAVMERRGLTLAALAKATEVPYRSLQNYFSRNTEMPVSVYLKICSALDIDGNYPLIERFNIDRYALRSALVAVLGEMIPRPDFTPDGAMILVPSGDRLRSELDLARDADTLALFIRSRYDIERETRLSRRVDDGEN